MVTASKIKGFMIEKKEVMEYPENDIHFVIKHGQEIEQAKGHNEAIDLQGQKEIGMNRERLIEILSLRIGWNQIGINDLADAIISDEEQHLGGPTMKTQPPRPSGWRYVVIRKTKRVAGKMYHWYDIHELFNIDGKESWTIEPVYNGHEDLNDTRWALAMMLADSYREPVRIIKGDKLIKRAKND